MLIRPAVKPVIFSVSYRVIDLSGCGVISLCTNYTYGWCYHCREKVPLLWISGDELTPPPETWFKCGYCLKRDLSLRYLSESEAVLKNQQAKEDNTVFFDRIHCPPKE
ncbi:MAG: hypothetical protein IKD23_09490 [Lentisphaeria bacterium]|nr:hypothetical protein [Lentisphaeria bacterium]